MTGGVPEDAQVVLNARKDALDVIRRKVITLTVFALFVLCWIPFSALTILGGGSASSGGVGDALWQVYYEISGRITSSEAFDGVIACLGVCATMTVTLTVGRSRNLDLVQKVQHAVWRNCLSGVAYVAAVGSLVMAALTSISGGPRTSSGVWTLALFFAAVCVMLASSIAADSNETDLLTRYNVSGARLRRVIRRRRRIGSMAYISRDFACLPRKSRVLGYILRAIAIGSMPAVVLVGISLTMSIARGASNSIGLEDARRAIALALIGSVTALISGYYSYLRWVGYDTSREKWQLLFKSYVIRSVGIALALLTAYAGSGTWLAFGVLTSYLLSVPTSVWTVIHLSRVRPHTRLIGWLGAPFWGAVSINLEQARRRQSGARRQAREALNGLGQ